MAGLSWVQSSWICLSLIRHRHSLQSPKSWFFCILDFVVVVVMFCEIIFACYGYKLLLSHVTPGTSEGAVWKMHPFWDGMLLPGSLI